MKLQKYLTILPLALAVLPLSAAPTTAKEASFHFSTQVTRSIEKDRMQAEVYSRKSGKKLSELKKSVSANLKQVLVQAKQQSDIDVSAEGVRHYAEYDNKGKVIGWVAEGRIQLSSQNIDAIAKILDQLGENVAISYIDFSVSKEKMAALEDEMTKEILQQFQHKAELIKQQIQAEHYQLAEIQLVTPNSLSPGYGSPRSYVLEAAAMAKSSDQLPLEAGKQTISATASGKVVFFYP